MTSKRAMLAMAAITATIPTLLFTTALAGEPVGGSSSIICDEQGVCVEHQTVVCPEKSFAWGLRCWNKKEGAAFRTWLERHGGPQHPRRFKQRHPELAAMFGADWPGVNWRPLERDFHKALHHAANRFGVSFHWLHNCAHQEGGHGPRFIYNNAGSGAYGPFQYMSGTFASFASSAFKVRGHPPASYRRIDSVVGQTWTTAWAFSRGLSYHWVAPAC